jgi:short-subunit dehydrogenase
MKNHHQYYRNATILITGASMGIGKALALALAPYNTNLILCARSIPLLHSLRKECLQLGANHVAAIGCDVTDASQCEQVVKNGLAECGVDHLDVLLLNAGVSGSIEFSEMTTEQVQKVFKTMMDINFMGYVNFVHFCLPYLQKRSVSSANKPAHIGVLSSMSGLIGVPYRTAYCASKFAVNGFFEVLRNELTIQQSRNYNVRPIQITLAQPGWVDTGIRDRHLVEMHKEQYKDTKNDGKVMSVEQCVNGLLKAMKQGKREERFILKQKIVPLIKAISPSSVDSMITKHVIGEDKPHLQSKL